MTSAEERFEGAARARGLEPDVQRWPEGTRTAADAAMAVGCDVAQIVKSLVFVADDNPVVALTSGTNRVDLDKLANALDADTVRKADAGEVRSATGYAIGGTPPFGYPAPLTVVIDEDLLAHPRVWAAAGTPETVFAIEPDALRQAAQATTADIAET
ncbi:MAG: YbaK/EbsC family protein [Actinobacteria bacterium]|nr:YbaK/EbsC family protein [Actinomycetota bacterium]